jgi:hypothetical protein
MLWEQKIILGDCPKLIHGSMAKRARDTHRQEYR